MGFIVGLIERIETALRVYNDNLRVSDGRKLSYSSEILGYSDSEPSKYHSMEYETDILVYERLDSEKWTPRVIVEAKINRVTTYDSIIIKI